MLPRPLLFVFCATILAAGCVEQRLPEFGESRPVIAPATASAYGPRITLTDESNAVLSWMQTGEETPTLRFAKYALDQWSDPMLAVEDDQMFVNWADLPSVTALSDDAYLAHWLSYTADAPYAYQILTSQSADGGETWSAAISPHDDDTPTEHGFVSQYFTGDGVGMIWLDGRETPDGGMTLRTATLNSAGEIAAEQALDDLVCDCCQTDVALAASGPVAVYRDRTSENIRDVAVTRFVDGEWLAGTLVNEDGWKIDGCPVNGPAIDAKGDHVVIAWFTAANGQPVVKTAISKNGGKSFSAPLEIATGQQRGHVGIVIINQQSVAISWMETSHHGSYTINIRGMTFDGKLGPVETVGRTSVANTVPQLVRVDDQLLLAWSDQLNDVRKIASVRVPILGYYN